MLKVCLVVDCEGFISFRQGNPRWSRFERLKGKVNSLIKNFRYNPRGFDLVYRTVMDEKFPSTFMLVGKLHKPKKNNEIIEWGYHTLNHLPLTLLDSKAVERETENVFGVKSLSPPLWMVEDAGEPGRVLRILEKKGYQNITYRGEDFGIKHKHHFAIEKPLKRGKLNLVYISNWFEGNSKTEDLKRIFEEIKKNAGKDAVYCLTTHDFTHRNTKNLRIVLKNLKKLENENKIKIIRFGELK